MSSDFAYRSGRRLLACALAAAMAPAVLAANVIHVPGDALTVQAGIDLAQNGDTVLVAPGTYNEAIDFLGKTIIVESSDGAEVTIIDATGLDTSVVTVRSGEGEGTQLRGFTITGGIGTLSGQAAAGGAESRKPRPDLKVAGEHRGREGAAALSEQRLGGGIYVQEASILIEHCTIVNNHVQGDNSAGGGLLIGQPQTVSLRYCTVENNTAFLGGGGVILAGFVQIMDCTFRNNAANQGGGLNVNNGASAIVGNTLFEANAAVSLYATNASGGGAMIIASHSVTFTQCHFLNNVVSSNSSTASGGGVNAFHASHTAVFDQCIFEGNSAPRGGGISISAPVTVQTCQFIGNEAFATQWTGTGSGGGIYASWTISPPPAPPTITDSTFIGNTAQAGGGAHFRRSVNLSNCMFEDNTAVTGGGIDVLLRDGVIPTITGSTFAGNEAETGGGLALMKSQETAADHVYANITECHFENNVADDGGGMFVGGFSASLMDDFGVDISHSTFAGNTAQTGGGLGLRTTMSDPNLAGGPHPTVSHSTFADNSATSSGGGVASFGGSSRARFLACTFENNAAETGGGVRVWGSGTHWPGQVFLECTFAGNNASGSGGALHVATRTRVTSGVFTSNTAQFNGGAVAGGGSEAILEYSLFAGNEATSGGAVSASGLAITRCTFENNQASASGGALVGATWTTHSTFTGNSAGLRGGAIAASAGTPTIAGCEMTGNSAAIEGGAIYSSGNVQLQSNVACANSPDNFAGSMTDLGGNQFDDDCHMGEVIAVPQDYATIQAAIDAALYGDEIVVAPGTYNEAINFAGKRVVLRSSEGPEVTTIDASGWPASPVTAASFEGLGTTLRGFTITGGTGFGGSGAGGGIYTDRSTLVVDDCTVISNSATTGGGIYVGSQGHIPGDVTVTNSRVIANQATSGGGIRALSRGRLHLADSLLEDNIASYGGGLVLTTESHATSADCEFRNNTASISGGAIATSSDSMYSSVDSLYCGSAPDHIGPFGPGGGQWTDLGGNEFLDDCPPGPVVGDLNGDGVVDVSDLLILLAAWGPCPDPGDCPADLNGDGAVDVSDLLILLANWG